MSDVKSSKLCYISFVTHLKRLLGLLILLVFGYNPFLYSALDTKESIQYEWLKSLPLLDQGAVPPSELPGHPVILFFWNSLDYQSLNTLSILNDISKQLSSSDLRILGVYQPQYKTETSSDTVKYLRKAYQPSFPSAIDTEERIKSYHQITELPYLLFVNQDGLIKKKLFGKFSSREVVKGAVTLAAESYQPIIVNSLTLETENIAEISQLQILRLGTNKMTGYGNLEKIRLNTLQEFTLPDFLSTEQFYLKGSWKFAEDYVDSLSDDNLLIIQTKSRSLSLVIDNGADKGAYFHLLVNNSLLNPEDVGFHTKLTTDDMIADPIPFGLLHLVDFKKTPDQYQKIQIQVPSGIAIYQIILSDGTTFFNRDETKRAMSVPDEEEKKEEVKVSSEYLKDESST